MNETPTTPNNDEAQFTNAARRVVVDTAPVEPPLRMTERSKNILRGAGVVASVAAAGALVAGMGGGENNPDRGEADPTINSITVSEGANLRYDPVVDGLGGEPNLVQQLEEQVTITPDDAVRVVEDTNNGTWYGITKEDLSTGIPNFDDKSDKDDVIWVNEQGIASVDTDDSTNVAQN